MKHKKVSFVCCSERSQPSFISRWTLQLTMNVWLYGQSILLRLSAAEMRFLAQRLDGAAPLEELKVASVAEYMIN